MNEQFIESRVCDHAARTGWFVRKFVSPSNRGVPDRIFIRQGAVIFIEFKRPGEEPSPLQEKVIERMREHGAMVFVCDDIERGKAILDAY